MAGLGDSPLGTSPAGIGLPDDDATVPSGNSAMCRSIDPMTRDYTVDTETGHLSQTTPVRQRVFIRLLTLKGSSTSVPELGAAIPGKMDERFSAKVVAAVHEALRQEVEVERVMSILSIDVQRSNRRAAIHVRYQDLTTGEPGEVTV